jgi:putative transposase
MVTHSATCRLHRKSDLDQEIRRRTEVVGAFPGRNAIIRLAGMVLAEQTYEWTKPHRRVGLEILAAGRPKQFMR